MTTNQLHTEYPPPVLRAASPASSVGTTYGLDETSYSDSESQLSQPAFERKWEERLELRRPRPEEEIANKDPLLPRTTISHERKAMFEQIMHTLRGEIQQLEENELFDQTLLRGSQAAMPSQPTTNDIDALMKSMMGPSLNINSAAPDNQAMTHTKNSSSITNGPWNNFGKSRYVNDGSISIASGQDATSRPTAGKRSRNGTSRRA